MCKNAQDGCVSDHATGALSLPSQNHCGNGMRCDRVAECPLPCTPGSKLFSFKVLVKPNSRCSMSTIHPRMILRERLMLSSVLAEFCSSTRELSKTRLQGSARRLFLVVNGS